MIRNCCVGLYEKAFPEALTLAEMLSLTRQSGYDFFELSIDRTEKRIQRIYNDAFDSELQNAVSISGAPVHSIGLSALSTYTLGNTDDSVASRAMDILFHGIDFAVRNGIRIIQIPACDMGKFDPRSMQTDARFLENLGHAVEYASAHAVVLGIENMENEYMDTVSKCMRAVRKINSPYLQLYPDVGNITNAWKNNKKNMLCDMDAGVGYYLAIHEKEVQPTRYGGLYYGEGHVDFQTLTAKAYSLGIRRFVMEYWYTGNENWKQDLITARELISSWIPKEEYS